MPNILDDLFQWAAQQPSGQILTVGIAITTNEITRNNLVSYAEGMLGYSPGHSAGWLFFPPSFASSPDGVKQYFSDRRWGTSDFGGPPHPFDPNNTDPLTVSIGRPILTGDYKITLKSSKWGFTESFTPIFDPASHIIYGSVGGGFVTISLCGKTATPKPK